MTHPGTIPDTIAAAQGLDITDGPDMWLDATCPHLAADGHLFGPCEQCDTIADQKHLAELDAAMCAGPDDHEAVRLFFDCPTVDRTHGWWLTSPPAPQWSVYHPTTSKEAHQ